MHDNVVVHHTKEQSGSDYMTRATSDAVLLLFRKSERESRCSTIPFSDAPWLTSAMARDRYKSARACRSSASIQQRDRSHKLISAVEQCDAFIATVPEAQPSNAQLTPIEIERHTFSKKCKCNIVHKHTFGTLQPPCWKQPLSASGPQFECGAISCHCCSTEKGKYIKLKFLN